MIEIVFSKSVSLLFFLFRFVRLVEDGNCVGDLRVAHNAVLVGIQQFVKHSVFGGNHAIRAFLVEDIVGQDDEYRRETERRVNVASPHPRH